jgi:hypothetical protein
MNHSIKHSILLLGLLLLASAALADAVSMTEVQNDFNNSDYKLVVQKTARLFASSTAEPLPADKYQMLMLRGESQLQLKDRLAAMTAFKAAAKSAGDVDQLALAKADALISERSAMGKYTPRFAADKTPIDILPMESRKQAMRALQADLWAQNKSLIDIALNATTLPPIEKAFAPLADMFCLETAATGQAEETGKLMRQIGTQTYRLMQNEAVRYSRTIDQLTITANSSTDTDGNWGGTRRGLFSNEQNQLKDAAAYLVKLRDRAAEYRGIASKVGGDEQRWDSLVLSFNDSLAAAETLLNTDR